MVVRDKREISMRPVLLKFGVALAISLGGILYTFFRTKRIKPPKPKPSHNPPDCRTRSDSRGQSGGQRDDNHALQDSPHQRVSSPSSISDLSPNNRHSGDRDAFILPEFNELVKECSNFSPKKYGESLVPDIESPREYRCTEYEDKNREIKTLRNQVKILEERERSLEMQLLEYYGLKEKETAVMELQNRLKLNNMEAKLYNLKIESLSSDNRRLEAKVSDYVKVVTELEAAKAKVKLLRKKLRSEAEQNREQILSLQEKVMKLKDREIRAVESDRDVEVLVKRRNELEEELEEMKKSNELLKVESSELAQKLEYVQMLATSALDSEEAQELKEEVQKLRRQNDDLKKEIEQLQTDRCTDIEELVYLRWTNACLRYELRNFQPGPGKTIARDLSKTLSPKSEEKAKKLILDYANKEGSNFTDFDSDQWSSSQVSYLTDSPDDSSVDTLSANKTDSPTKSKVFAKLIRLFRGKDSNTPHHHVHSPLERTVSVEDTMGSRYSSDSYSESRRSFDLPRSYSRSQRGITRENSNGSRRNSDDISLSIFRRIDSINEDADESSCSRDETKNDERSAEKMELVKYAEALKKTRAKSSTLNRSSSFGSF